MYAGTLIVAEMQQLTENVNGTHDSTTLLTATCERTKIDRQIDKCKIKKTRRETRINGFITRNCRIVVLRNTFRLLQQKDAVLKKTLLADNLPLLLRKRSNHKNR